LGPELAIEEDGTTFGPELDLADGGIGLGPEDWFESAIDLQHGPARDYCQGAWFAPR
jgi:hypothetical protein